MDQGYKSSNLKPAMISTAVKAFTTPASGSLQLPKKKVMSLRELQTQSSGAKCGID
jgi:hypothetical protein